MEIPFFVKKRFAPKVDCPGATEVQVVEFLRGNTIFGGRIVLDSPRQLDSVRGFTMLGGELIVKGDRISMRSILSLGGRIEID